MNIVFDLGGVVFNWQPDRIIASVFDDPDTRRLVKKVLIEHRDWVELDRGTLSRAQAIERCARRAGLNENDIERLLDAVPHFLTPIEPTIELVRELSDTDNSLYVVSNMAIASIEHLEREHDIWHLFDGVVISSRVKMVKPEPAIFEYLLQTFQLRPDETIFIDDMPENVAAAEALGIVGIRFEHAAQCRQALNKHLGA